MNFEAVLIEVLHASMIISQPDDRGPQKSNLESLWITDIYARLIFYICKSYLFFNIFFNCICNNINMRKSI